MNKMNISKMEAEKDLSKFLADFGFVLALEKVNGVHFAVYGNERLLIAFCWDARDGNVIKVAHPYAILDPIAILNCENGWAFVGDHWPQFTSGYVEAVKVLPYPETPSEAEYYRFTEQSLREFLRMVDSKQVDLGSPVPFIDV